MHLVQRWSWLALGAALLVPVAHADCERPALRTEVDQSVAQAQVAFASMDREGFAAARDHAHELLRCLAESMSGPEIAEFHSMMALDAYLGHDDAGTVNSFRSALAADSGFSLPANFVPNGHPLYLQQKVATSLVSSPGRALPDLGTDWVAVDGARAIEAPSDRPAVLQLFAYDAELMDSHYLAIGADLPDWRPPPVTIPSDEPKRRPLLLAGATGVAALVAGGLYAAASGKHSSFVDEGTPYEDLSSLRSQARAFSYGSMGAGVLTLGLGTALVIMW